MAQKTSFASIVAAVAMLLTTNIGYCADVKGEVDSQLITAVGKLVEYWTNQDYKSVWQLTSKHFKHGNEDNQAAHEKYVRSAGFHSGRIDILNHQINEGVALVTVKVVYLENASNNELGSALEEWKFVYENQSWLFDDYKTLSESAN